MQTNKSWLILLALVVAVPARGADAASEKAGKVVVIEGQKLEEAEAKGRMEEPTFGYVGPLGSFQAAKKTSAGEMPTGFIVVHNYPNVEKIALGHTKLKYVGAKRLGNVDGWVFETDWDGKHYPSKIFFSAEQVYFGGGVVAYIAADFRTETGWTWKNIPLRRMDLLEKKGSAE